MFSRPPLILWIALLVLMLTSLWAEQFPACKHIPDGRTVGFDRCKYPLAGPDVKPPKPFYMPEPSYGELPRSALQQGTMSFFVAINQDGAVEDVRLERSLTPQMDELAAQALRKWKFDPPVKNGIPVAVQMQVEFGYIEH